MTRRRGRERANPFDRRTRVLLNIQKKRIEPDIMVVELEGRVCLGNAAKEFEWEVLELQKANEKKVIIDLSRVTQLDSTGIGILAMCSGKLKSAGGELRVAGAQGVVQEVLKLTHMENVLSLYPTQSAAASGFKGAGSA